MRVLRKKKQEIQAQNEPLPFFPKYMKPKSEKLVPTNNHIPKQKFPPKYIIELAVFVDKPLYEILQGTFRYNTRELVANIVLAMINMVRKTYKCNHFVSSIIYYKC